MLAPSIASHSYTNTGALLLQQYVSYNELTDCSMLEKNPMGLCFQIPGSNTLLSLDKPLHENTRADTEGLDVIGLFGFVECLAHS